MRDRTASHTHCYSPYCLTTIHFMALTSAEHDFEAPASPVRIGRRGHLLRGPQRQRRERRVASVAAWVSSGKKTPTALAARCLGADSSSPRDLCCCLRFVPQDPSLFAGTIYSNVTHGSASLQQHRTSAARSAGSGSGSDIWSIEPRTQHLLPWRRARPRVLRLRSDRGEHRLVPTDAELDRAGTDPFAGKSLSARCTSAAQRKAVLSLPQS